MKIVIDATILADNREGIGQYIESVISNLPENAVAEYHLVTLTNTHLAVSRATIHEVSVKQGPLYGLRKAWAVRNYARGISADLVFGTESHYLPLLYPTVWLVHDISPLTHPQYFYAAKPGLGWRIYKRVYSLAIRKARKILTTSQFIAQEISNTYGLELTKIAVVGAGAADWTKIETAPGTIAEVLNRYGLKSNEYFLSINTLSPRKNIPTLIRAFTEFLLKSPVAEKYKLVLAGKEGWLTQEVYDTITKLDNLHPNLKLNSKIVLTGYIDKPTIKSLTLNCTALTYTSLYEGFGMPPLEAISLGKEVVLSDIPVFREIYNGVGHFFPISTSLDDQAISLAEQLNKVVQGSKLNTDIVRNNLVGQYNWKTTTINIITQLHETAQNLR